MVRKDVAILIWRRSGKTEHTFAALGDPGGAPRMTAGGNDDMTHEDELKSIMASIHFFHC